MTRTRIRAVLALAAVLGTGCVFEAPSGLSGDVGSTHDAHVAPDAGEEDARIAEDAMLGDAPPGEDATLDAAADAGELDATDLDASSDAANPDANPDAASPDTGPLDAGALDATPFDAGLDPGETAYADSSTAACSNSSSCGDIATPCCRIADAVDADRDYVYIRAGTYSESLDIGMGRRVELVAEPGAILDSPSGAQAMDIHQGSVLVVRGLTVHAQGSAVLIRESGTTASFFGCTIGPSGGLGFDIKNGTAIVLERNLVTENDSGGIKLDTNAVPYRIANNIIVNNGLGAAEFGGLYIKKTDVGSMVINNTIAQNHVGGAATATSRGGIRCDAMGALITNTIIWNNELGAGVGSTFSSICNVRYSDIGPIGTATIAPTNFSTDPLFATGGFHLSATSPCIDSGDPAGTLAAGGNAPDEDIDGDPRPQGNGVDVGADEVR